MRFSTLGERGVITKSYMMGCLTGMKDQSRMQHLTSRGRLRQSNIVRGLVLDLLWPAILVYRGLDVKRVEDGGAQQRESFVREIASRADPA